VRHRMECLSHGGVVGASRNALVIALMREPGIHQDNVGEEEKVALKVVETNQQGAVGVRFVCRGGGRAAVSLWGVWQRKAN